MTNNDASGSYTDEDTTCPTCGRDDFASVRGMKSHHARSHGESIAGVAVVCNFCGEETRTRPSSLATNEHHFCDEICRGKWRSECLSGRNAPLWSGGMETIECHFCGDEIKRYRHEIERSERNFCDATCRGAWRSDNWMVDDLPRWNGGPVTVQCYQCEKKFERKRSQIEEYERQFCSRSCFGEWRSEFQRGKNNPSWTGGSDVRVSVRDLLGDRPWKKVTEEERGSECELCGVHTTADGRALSVHHLVPIMAGGCNESELLMTLCTGCHRKVEASTRKFVEPVLVDG